MSARSEFAGRVCARAGFPVDWATVALVLAAIKFAVELWEECGKDAPEAFQQVEQGSLPIGGRVRLRRRIRIILRSSHLPAESGPIMLRALQEEAEGLTRGAFEKVFDEG